MTLEVDHAFIACSSGAPEGDALVRLGLVEGSRNTHLGQGTANRRFFFENFMLELLWVANPAEATKAKKKRRDGSRVNLGATMVNANPMQKIRAE